MRKKPKPPPPGVDICKRRAKRFRPAERMSTALLDIMPDKVVPPFDPRSSRYDQSEFRGRYKNFCEMTDPRNLFISKQEVADAQSLLRQHAGGEAVGVTDVDLWNAKRIKDAVIHPVTNEEMFLPGRMSAFVPANTVPTAGMLLARSPAATVRRHVMRRSAKSLASVAHARTLCTRCGGSRMRRPPRPQCLTPHVLTTLSLGPADLLPVA